MGFAYDDYHQITFGKHEGKALKDVPAGYLIWIADSPKSQETVGIFGYVHKNRAKLEEQSADEKNRYKASKGES